MVRLHLTCLRAGELLRGAPLLPSLLLPSVFGGHFVTWERSLRLYATLASRVFGFGLRAVAALGWWDGAGKMESIPGGRRSPGGWFWISHWLSVWRAAATENLVNIRKDRTQPIDGRQATLCDADSVRVPCFICVSYELYYKSPAA